MASQQPYQQNRFPPLQPQTLQPPVSNGNGQPPPTTRFSAPPTSIPNYSSQPLTRPPIPGQGSAFAPISQSTTNTILNGQVLYNQPGLGAGVQQPPQQMQHSIRPSAIPATSPVSSGPSSNQTSANPSPVPSMSLDRMEGQFPLNGAASPAGSASNLYNSAQTSTRINANSNLNGPSQHQQLSNPANTSSSFPASNAVRPQQEGYFQPPTSTGQMPPIVGLAGMTTNRPPINGGYSGMSNGPPTMTGPQSWNTAYPPSTPFPPQGQNPLGLAPYPQANYPQRTNQPISPYPNSNPTMDRMTSQMGSLSVTQTGFDKLWGHDNVDLLQVRHILPSQGVETPRIRLRQDHHTNVNCSADIFRCTLTKIPESSSVLQKSRLPLGILIHPFKDLTQLPVIQCQTIVRCRTCRTYINPFVYFPDQRRWKCNICFRLNELPEEFQYDPMTNSYGDPTRRPEIKNSTIEFIAPAEYMLRPPQPPVYLYLLDVSQSAVENGYLRLFCDVLLDELEKIPGDGRTQIGFITFDSSVHFYNLSESLSRPLQMIVSDIDEIFLPCPDDLLVNLNESKRLVEELLNQLPTKFNNTTERNSALGAALQAAYNMISHTGGRVTVFQASLPNVGPGALKSREDPNQRAGKDVPNLNPATDFYKKFALDCSGKQVAVDLFLLGGQYMDIASLSCVSKYSGGCIQHFPGFHYVQNSLQVERLEHSLRRYLTRKIGFESVMRVRCTEGLSIHTFHGNFFVRSTDLLSLPNINPDAGFGLQVSIDQNLAEVQNVSFQAALLYTSSKGERRIRVHTLCLPIASTVAEVLQSADQQCIVGLLSKMAVDRSLQSSLSDARDALVNVCVDVLAAYKATLSSSSSGLYAPSNLRLLPLYVAALLKSVAFRTGQSTRLDDRVFAMNQLKVLPLLQLILSVYPDLYAIHNLSDQGAISQGDMVIPQPPRLHLSAEMVDSTGSYLLDTGDVIYLYVGRNVNPSFVENVLGSPSFQALPQQMYELPELETHESERLRNFLVHLQNQRPYPAVLQLIREDSQVRYLFTNHLVDGRTESSLSYYEFLQHLKTQVK